MIMIEDHECGQCKQCVIDNIGKRFNLRCI
uniref:Uncharacterized protein n=1 Tax=Anopheles albimanus TaxID=7167 RepID=A0A182FYJ4_ANOAL